LFTNISLCVFLHAFPFFAIIMPSTIFPTLDLLAVRFCALQHYATDFHLCRFQLFFIHFIQNSHLISTTVQSV
jgi:hypothetical protein